MQLDLTLLLEYQELIEGLANGSLKRFGGVVRNADNGRIVKHLIEAPGATEELRMAPLSQLLGGAGISAQKGLVGVLDSVVNVAGHAANMTGHRKTHVALDQVQRTLGSVLQVSQIAAAASVLNLGVSVAGFAYMGYKLNQLQKSMTAIQDRLDTGFDHVDAKLDGIVRQLGYLVLLSEANFEEQQRIRTSLAELHRAVLIAELAELQSWLDQLTRFPQDNPKDAIRVASKVRRTLSDQAVRATPEFDARVMLVADVSIRGWMVATATEAQLLMDLGHHGEARQLIESEHPRFAALAESWAGALMADERPQLRTAYRFAAPRFQGAVLPERIERIARIHGSDRALTEGRRLRAAKEAGLELEMSHNASLGEEWTHRQIAIAEYVDGMSELSDRLESLGAFAGECEARQLPSSRAALPGPDAKPGIYVLPAASYDE